MSIQAYEHRADVALASAQDVAVQRLGEWARSAEAAHHIAATLVQTSFCPDQFRGKAGEATAAILAGMELGLQPMAALRSFDVIQGQAAPRAITLRAVVQSYGHEMVLVESTETRCVMKGHRKGTTEWSKVTWTIDRAKKLGVTNKPNWRNQPQTMLVARATTELARLIASDAIVGVGYSSEEIEDGGTGAPAEPVTAPEAGGTGTRRMSRRKPAEDAEPAVDEPQDAADEPAPGPQDDDEIIDVKSGLALAMFAAVREADVSEDDRIAWLSNVIGREVTSSKEMTAGEVRMVLRFLDKDAE